MLYWKWKFFWKKWGSRYCPLKMNRLYSLSWKERGERSQILVMHICILHMRVFKNSEFINSMGKASPKFLNLFNIFYAQMKYIIFSFSFPCQRLAKLWYLLVPCFLKLYKIVLVSINGFDESKKKVYISILVMGQSSNSIWMISLKLKFYWALMPTFFQFNSFMHQ